MIDVISSGLASLKTAREIASGISSLKEDVAVKLKAAELLAILADAQASLLDAQSKIFELQGELRGANEKLKRRADFSRYKLCEPFPGTFIHKLRDEVREPDEPKHFICPKCKEDEVLAMLYGPSKTEESLRCKKCGASFRIKEKPEIQYDLWGERM